MDFTPVTRAFGRTTLQLRKHSPHILFVTGIVGGVTTVVLACRATLKLEKTTDEIRTDLHNVKMMRSDAILKDDGEYSDRDYYRDLGYVYGKTIYKFGSLYGPTIVVGIFSVGCLSGSHAVMARRNSALAFTLAGVTQAFDEYRDRVRDEMGEERERDIYRGIRRESIEVDGKEKVVARMVNDDLPSPYAVVFDEFSSPSCFQKKSAEYNRIFLQVQQSVANDKLRAQGHLFLNEVYDMLGVDRTPAGAVCGWIYGSEEGDGHVDFGLWEAFNHRAMMEERKFVLDFNVDGQIYEKI